MKVISSSGTSVYVQTTRRYMPEDGNIHNYNMLVFRNNGIVQKEGDDIRVY
jgi:hypothetical protein